MKANFIESDLEPFNFIDCGLGWGFPGGSRQGIIEYAMDPDQED